MDLKINIEPYLYLYASDGKTKIPIGQFVVRIRQHKGDLVKYYDNFDQQVKSLYIGRACYRGGYKLDQSKWHNSFKLSQYSNDIACKLYRDHVLNSGLSKDLHELKGVLLMCFCDDITKCHGSVLRDLVNQLC